MTSPTVQKIQEYLKTYKAIPGWDTLRAERADMIVPIVLEHAEGHILEIGALKGTTTAIFCRAAEKYQRRVFVIDPWDGRQGGNNSIHGEFRKNTSHFKNLTVYRRGSESLESRKSFLANNIKFAFILIDGLHGYEAVKNDINLYADLLMPNGVLCFDDWQGPYGFCKSIQQAANDHLNHGLVMIQTPDSFIERYFIKVN